MPVGTPAGTDKQDEARRAILDIVACLGSGDAYRAISLFTQSFLMTRFGTVDPDQLATTGFFSRAVLDIVIDEIQTSGGGTALVTLTLASAHFGSAERWELVRANSHWRIARIESLAPVPSDGNAATLRVQLSEYAIKVNATEIPLNDVIILRVFNAGSEAHDIALVRLGEGQSLHAAAASPAVVTPESATPMTLLGIYGPLEPGHAVNLSFTALSPGTYALGSFYPGSDGTPPAQQGITAAFTVVG